MKKSKVYIGLFIVSFILLSEFSQAQIRIVRQLVGSGGGRSNVTDGKYIVGNSVGQSVIGKAENNPPINFVYQGYWTINPFLWLSVETPNQVEVKKNITNYPNPVNNFTNFTYKIDKDSRVMLKIYNITGQEIITLFNDIQSGGEHTLNWDVIGSNGLAVGNGTYLYELTVSPIGSSNQNVYTLRNIMVIAK